MAGLRRLYGLAVVAAVGLAGALPATAHAVPGQLTQLPGLEGCWSDTGDVAAGADQCRDAEALEDPLDVTVSPDGRNVYVGALNALLVFSRNPQTGALTQLPGTAGCLKQQGEAGNCMVVRAVEGVRGVAVSADGRHVYVASYDEDAVAVLKRRSSDGALRQSDDTTACIHQTGGNGCADGKALDALRGVSVSPDGRSVYAANEFDEAVVVLRRDPNTGGLTQLADPNGCVSDTSRSDAGDPGTAGQCADGGGRMGDPFWTAVSPDGNSVYSASDGNFILNFRRNASTGALALPAGPAGCVAETVGPTGCADGTGLQDPRSVEVSPDNRHVYSGQIQSESIAAFSRDLNNGTLTQLSGNAACVNDDGDEGCADGRALGSAWGVAVAPDGDNVYIAADDGNAVAAFARNRSTGALAQLAGQAGCLQDAPTAAGSMQGCATGRGLADAQEAAVSPDCRNVYAVAENDNALTVFAREAPACLRTTTPPPGDDTTPPGDDPTPGSPDEPEDGFRDRDCGEFDSQEEAQRFFDEEGGPEEDRHRLDEDDDGEACERFKPAATTAGAAETGAEARDGEDLPITGFQLVLVISAGALVAGGGAALRRTTR